MESQSTRRGITRRRASSLLGERRRVRNAFIAGVVTAAGGLAALMTFVWVEHQTLDWVRLMGTLSLVAIIVGVVVAGIALLAIRGRSIEEAYQLGYDIGFERGFMSGSGDETITDVVDEAAGP